MHVGDSRCYRWRDGELERLTTDHSLVEELVRQGRLSPEEAEEHPQRSIITRALGPEAVVQPDALTVPARAGDVFLLCSDGLTSMVHEAELRDRARRTRRRCAPRRPNLVERANSAGGRDNITVVLFRLDEAGGAGGAATPPTSRRSAPRRCAPRTSSARSSRPSRRARDARAPAAPAGAAADAARRCPRPLRRARRRRRLPRPGLGTALIVALVLTVLAGGYLASQAVYFVGTGRGRVRDALPRRAVRPAGGDRPLPGGLRLRASATRSSRRRSSTIVAEQSLRSREDADAYLRQLERGSVGR